MKSETYPVTLRTPETLLKQEEFTFGEWVQAHGWDVAKAIAALDKAMEDDLCPSLQQHEDDAGDNGVWDGGFEMVNGSPMFVGNDGPSGGSGVIRQRVIRAIDVIEMMM